MFCTITVAMLLSVAPSPSVTVTVHSILSFPTKDTVVKSSVCHHPSFARREILPRVGFGGYFTIGIRDHRACQHIITGELEDRDRKICGAEFRMSTGLFQGPSTYPSFGDTHRPISFFRSVTMGVYFQCEDRCVIGIFIPSVGFSTGDFPITTRYRRHHSTGGKPESD